MSEDVILALDEANDQMEKAITHLSNELGRLRAGKANPAMIESVKVEYYGALTPLHQVANVSTPDARSISIQPWEKNLLGPIEKAIINSNLGFNPSNDGVLIRIIIPPLTEERRRELVKKAKAEGENAKVTVRNARRDANEYIKKLQKDGLPEDMAKDGESKVQQITDKFIVRIDDILAQKEKEIMTV